MRRPRSRAARTAIGIAGFALVAIVLTVAAGWSELEAGTHPLLIASSDLQVGDVRIRLDQAALVDAQESRVRIRALGLEPRVEVAWLGSGDHRPFAVELENLNLRVGRLSLAPGTVERDRRGTTLELAASLESGPLGAALALPAEAAAHGQFGVVGCTRSNRLITAILRGFAADAPLFVVHLGDVGQGDAYESEALRNAFDELGIPLFVAPGNHDRDPLSPKALGNFHRYLNPAPFSFSLGGQRFTLLDVSDYPVAREQLAALRDGPRASREWYFLHRSPIDPWGTGHELPPDSGVAELERIVASERDSRTYAGHIQGYAEGSFGGHPFVMSSGGGERAKDVADGFSPDPYHYVIVPLDGGPPVRRPLREPSWLAGIASSARIELPPLARHLDPGLAASGLLVSAWAWRRRVLASTARRRARADAARARATTHRWRASRA